MSILTKSKYTGVLFLVDADKRKDNGPIMLGNIKLNDKEEVSLSAFLPKEPGKEFYSLSVGGKDQEHLYGALFPVKKKTVEKGPDYTGSISLDKEGNERLYVAGWKKKTKDDKTFFSLAIEPSTKKEETAQDETATA